MLNRSLIIFGGSGSGKSYMTQYLLKIISGAFETNLLFNPTFHDTGDYIGIFPEQFVYDDPTKVTLETFSNITQRQEEVNRISKIVDENIRDLFMKVASRTDLESYERVTRAYKRKLEETTDNTERDLIDYGYKNSIGRYYRSVVIKNQKQLNYDKLSENEKYAIKYAALNPHGLFIFDDFYTEFVALLKESRKKEKLDLPNFYFRGRHKKITIWLLVQGYKLDTEVRKNAHTMIFTSRNLALGYYSLPENSTSGYEQKKMEAVIDFVFNEQKCGNPYYKLYIDKIQNKVYYIVAEPTKKTDIRLFSPAVLEFINRVKSDSATRVKTKYSDRFDNLI